MSSDAQSTLALLADEFIHIKDSSNFAEDGKLFLDTTKHRIDFYFESGEYHLDEPMPARIGYQPPYSGPRVNEKYINSHFSNKRGNKRLIDALKMLLVIIIIMGVLAAIFGLLFRYTGIIQPIEVNESMVNYTWF